MKQSVKPGVGKRAAKHVEAFFTAAHAGQPVVHERDSEIG